MKYVILIHSNPQPWGHPTGDFVAEQQALPPEQRERMNAAFAELLDEMSAGGELVSGEALGDPATRQALPLGGGPAAGDRRAVLGVERAPGESKEHLAGFFLLDVHGRERAEELAARFSGPGETVELRPAMLPGGDDQ